MYHLSRHSPGNGQQYLSRPACRTGWSRSAPSRSYLDHLYYTTLLRHRQGSPQENEQRSRWLVLGVTSKMSQRNSKRHERFSKTRRGHFQEMEQILKDKESEMMRQWEDVEAGKVRLERQKSEWGMVGNASYQDITTLNVGGSYVDIRRSDLEKMRLLSTQWTLANLLDFDWDKRLPRDEDDYIVLDEPPTHVKHLVETLGQSSHWTGPGLASDSAVLPAHEAPFLAYIARVIGLERVARPPGKEIVGGTSILKADEAGPFVSTIDSWCPSMKGGLELIYRASRDGWTPGAFHGRCNDDSPSTITLFRVKARGSDACDSVVGGFSSVPWTFSWSMESPGSFVFMLKDGGGEPNGFRPFKCDSRTLNCVTRGNQPGSGFGGMCPIWTGRPGCGIAFHGRCYNIPASMLSLHNQPLVEIEVFRLSPDDPRVPQHQPGLQRRSSWSGRGGHGEGGRRSGSGSATVPSRGGEEAKSMQTDEEYDDDVHRFGALIAESLKEERTALRAAQKELVQANHRAKASAECFAAVYGQGLAEGVNEDPVVEISVREPRTTTRITTLRSTLLICPEHSFFAANFNEDRFPLSESGLDPHGRRIIKDCRGYDFAKIVDVLRMRKRAVWAEEGSQRAGSERVKVVIEAASRGSFEQSVEMYFPSCTEFILDWVTFVEEPASGRAAAATSPHGTAARGI